ncbi:MAG: 8-oxoguanine DNA glycosylase, partial [Lachnospiraceae bacterium]|nr:8-oxoguanine DNA glycosylase [Lachnospiraceae bacterium]
AAARLGGGIRILRQELWEMIVTFIISQRNNIPRIRKCVAALCREFGEKGVDFRGKVYDMFPTPLALAQASEETLRGCGLGYRAPYIQKTARMVRDGQVNLDDLFSMDYAGAKVQLLKLCGVGEKVADCISLFALHNIEAFPVDTHIQDTLKRYPDGFPFERYAGFAGILQQYAFYYELFGTEE